MPICVKSITLTEGLVQYNFVFKYFFASQQASVSPAKKKKRKQNGIEPTVSGKKKLKKIPEKRKTKEEEDHDEPVHVCDLVQELVPEHVLR